MSGSEREGPQPGSSEKREEVAGQGDMASAEAETEPDEKKAEASGASAGASGPAPSSHTGNGSGPEQPAGADGAAKDEAKPAAPSERPGSVLEAMRASFGTTAPATPSPAEPKPETPAPSPSASPITPTPPAETKAEGDGDKEDDTERVELPRVEEAKKAEPAPVAATGDIQFRYFGLTDVGLVREHNEDNFLVADFAGEVRGLPSGKAREGKLAQRGAVFAVCDGMGGAAAGEVASQMAVDTVYEVLRRRPTRDGDPPADRDLFARRLVRAIEEAGHRIFAAAKMDRTRRGMGTTATVAGLVDKVLFVGQVGDSRAYVLRKGKFALITKDQSLVNQLIEAGQLTEEEAEAFEHSNIILQALGTTEDVSVDLTFLELRRGDRLLMCSDGLSGLVHADVMREVLETTDDLEIACKRLIEMANQAGGHDNITVIVASFDGEGLPIANDGAGVMYQQYPLPPGGDDDALDPLPPHRETSMKAGARKPGSDVKRALPQQAQAADEPRSGAVDEPQTRAFRGWLVLLVVMVAVVAAAVAVALSQSGTPEPEERPDTRDVEVDLGPAVEDAVEEAVEVRVRSDVVDGELFVDGEYYGQLEQGEDVVLELPPGAYRIEARSGGSVLASKVANVRRGAPTDVELMLPAGETRVEPGEATPVVQEPGGTEGSEATPPEGATKRRAGERQRERERERERETEPASGTGESGGTPAGGAAGSATGTGSGAAGAAPAEGAAPGSAGSGGTAATPPAPAPPRPSP